MCFLGDLETSVYAPLDFWTKMLKLESIEQNYIRSLKSVLQANSQLAQKGFMTKNSIEISREIVKCTLEQGRESHHIVSFQLTSTCKSISLTCCFLATHFSAIDIISVTPESIVFLICLLKTSEVNIEQECQEILLTSFVIEGAIYDEIKPNGGTLKVTSLRQPK